MTPNEIKHTKLTLETWHGEYSIKLDKWDYDISDFYNMCKSIALAASFPPETVEDFFDKEV